MPHKGVTTLESEASVELNLASNANGGEYSFDVAGETAVWIREHGVPAKREWTLRVARETTTSIQLDELSAILTVTVTVRLPRSVPAKHGHPEKISMHFPPPRRHSGVAKDAKD